MSFNTTAATQLYLKVRQHGSKAITLSVKKVIDGRLIHDDQERIVPNPEIENMYAAWEHSMYLAVRKLEAVHARGCKIGFMDDKGMLHDFPNLSMLIHTIVNNIDIPKPNSKYQHQSQVLPASASAGATSHE